MVAVHRLSWRALLGASTATVGLGIQDVGVEELTVYPVNAICIVPMGSMLMRAYRLEWR